LTVEHCQKSKRIKTWGQRVEICRGCGFCLFVSSLFCSLLHVL